METIIYILPELFLSIAIMTFLMLGVFIKNSYKLINLLTILSLLFAAILVLNQPDEIIKVEEIQKEISDKKVKRDILNNLLIISYFCF